jgi:hypothetical protein
MTNEESIAVLNTVDVHVSISMRELNNIY